LTAAQLTALLLQASFKASLEDYTRSLSAEGFPQWDMILLTASNEAQAEGYRRQLDYRRSLGLLPCRTEFAVLSDRDGMRIGSGGGALSVIRYLKRKYGSLSGKRFLTIQAGGFSQRCPQYSVLGKLFSPVPMTLAGHSATVFDTLLATMATLPSRMEEGMLLLSGDAFTLFDPLQCNFSHADAAIITVKEPARTAKDHGVCLRNERTGNVKAFYHKLPVARLQQLGAVDENGCCELDTGTVYLGMELMERLCGMVERDEEFDRIINDRVRLSLYGDINYALAEDSTHESLQQQTPESSFCPELTHARHALWQAVGRYTMKCFSMTPGKFLHFGTVPQVMYLMTEGAEAFSYLEWQKSVGSVCDNTDIAAYRSVQCPGSRVGQGVYLEESYVAPGAVVGDHAYLSFVDVGEGDRVPPGVLLHGLRLRDGHYVCRIMGTGDNPKEDRLFGEPLSLLSRRLGVPMEGTLWNSPLYPVCATLSGAVQAALNLYRMLKGMDGDAKVWQRAEKTALGDAFVLGDVSHVIDRHRYMGELAAMERLAQSARNRTYIEQQPPLDRGLTHTQQQWLQKQNDSLDLDRSEDFFYAMRLAVRLARATGQQQYIEYCFRLIREAVLRHTAGLPGQQGQPVIRQETATVTLPLRVNWGGGWSDTCPTCMEIGGTVLNAAILLGGKAPVHASVQRIPHRRVILSADDLGVEQSFDSLCDLREVGDPLDPFCLHKACLAVCGVLNSDAADMDDYLDAIGGGFALHTRVDGVPKGSGLGTSSILAAAAVEALLKFFGMDCTHDALYAAVLAVEQLMSTGGGWQDQAGGLSPGIKYIATVPGFAQRLTVQQVNVSETTRQELQRRYALIYTGQRRLAKNLLRDVVRGYLESRPDSVAAHRRIKILAEQMRLALEGDDVDGFALLLKEHLQLNKAIDADCTNLLIDSIFATVDDLIDGAMVCGAGGGGFLQVVLKKDVTKERLRQRLRDVFKNLNVDVWDCALLF